MTTPDTATPSATETSPRTTDLGTPCAMSWDDRWIAAVNARERSLGHRICGARTIGGLPCPMASKHASGRCRHHGGCPLTGAPAGNRNAVVHALYSRRLAVVGPHNPGWTFSLMGGVTFEGDSDINKLAAPDRAICPFEQAEYNAVVTDTLRRTCASGQNPYGMHLAHQVALLTVMVGRASRALANEPFTETVEQTVQKPSAALVAFEKLSRELRHWVQLVERHYPVCVPEPVVAREHEWRCRFDTGHDPDSRAALDSAGMPAREHIGEQKAPPAQNGNTAPRTEEKITGEKSQPAQNGHAAPCADEKTTAEEAPPTGNGHAAPRADHPADARPRVRPSPPMVIVHRRKTDERTAAAPPVSAIPAGCSP